MEIIDEKKGIKENENKVEMKKKKSGEIELENVYF